MFLKRVGLLINNFWVFICIEFKYFIKPYFLEFIIVLLSIPLIKQYIYIDEIYCLFWEIQFNKIFLLIINNYIYINTNILLHNIDIIFFFKNFTNFIINNTNLFFEINNNIKFLIFITMFSFFILSITIWARASGPRFRLDQLNYYTWFEVLICIFLIIIVIVIINK